LIPSGPDFYQRIEIRTGVAPRPAGFRADADGWA
jgi:hypothetical protein